MPAPKSTKEGPGVRQSSLRLSLTVQVPLDKQEKLHLVRRRGRRSADSRQYTMSTPNGKRAQIMLEELAETYGTKCACGRPGQAS